MRCPKCGGKDAVKYGKACGKQRWRCKSCSCQFTTEEAHGHSLEEKLFAMTLLVSGLSMSAVGCLLGVSTQTVLRWKKSGLIDFEKIEKAVRFRKASGAGKIKLIRDGGLSLSDENLSGDGGSYLLKTELPSGVLVDIAVKRNAGKSVKEKSFAGA